MHGWLDYWALDSTPIECNDNVYMNEPFAPSLHKQLTSLILLHPDWLSRT